MKKSYAANELGRFFVTGPTDAAGKPSHFSCKICRKDFSVLTHGPSEVPRQFQGARLFPRHQGLWLDTLVKRISDFDGNPFADDEVERQRENILLAPLVTNDRERLFTEELLVDESGAADANLPLLARLPTRKEVVRLRGSFQPVERLWSQFLLTASRVVLDVAWSRVEVLVIFGENT